MLAVLSKGRRADHLDLAAGECGLEDIGGIHAALGIARADDIVYLINDKDDVAVLSYLLDKPFHAALELAAELRARDERRQVEQVNLLILELRRDVAHSDALGEPLGDSRLADAGFADKAGVILLAAVEDLDNALKLLLAADHRIELTLAGAGGEVDAVIIKELALAALGGILLGLAAARLPALVLALV